MHFVLQEHKKQSHLALNAEREDPSRRSDTRHVKNRAKANNTAHTAGVSSKHQNDANESFPKHRAALIVENLDVARITAAPTTPAYKPFSFDRRQR